MVIKFPERMKLIADKRMKPKTIDLGGFLPLAYVTNTGELYKYNPETKMHECHV